MTETPQSGEISIDKPLWERRTPEIDRAIDFAYKKLESSPKRGYLFTGSDTYDFGFCEISSDVLIKRLIEKKVSGSLPLSILDIGSGYGNFLKYVDKTFNNNGKKVEVNGLNGPDFSDTVENLKPLRCQIGNAEELLSYYPPNSLDLIVSAMTFLHLVDPLGTIAQAYETLRHGGVMFIEGPFCLTGLDDLPSFFAQLRETGYEVFIDYNYSLKGNDLLPNEVKSLFLRKTHPSFKLPVIYRGVTDNENKVPRAVYSPVGVFPEIQDDIPKLLKDLVLRGVIGIHIINAISPNNRLEEMMELELERANELKKEGVDTGQVVRTYSSWRKGRNIQSEKNIERIIKSRRHLFFQ